MPIVYKYTEGYVEQIFDAENKKLLRQRFVSNDYVGWVPVDCSKDYYYPFDLQEPNDARIREN